MQSEITTVGELVATLAAISAQDLRAAGRRTRLPQATTIGAIACSPDDAEGDGRPEPDQGERVVWIGEGAQIGYLPEIARTALGQSWP